MNKITVTEKEMKNPQDAIYSLKMSRNQLRLNNRKLKEEIERLRIDADIDLLGHLMGDANIKARDEAIQQAYDELDKYINLYSKLNDKYEWIKANYEHETGNIVLESFNDGVTSPKETELVKEKDKKPTLSERLADWLMGKKWSDK